MTRKTVIRTALLLATFCSIMWMIPVMIETIERAQNNLTPHAGNPSAPNVSDWVRERRKNSDDEARLKLMGLSDPSMSIQQRVQLLDDAEKNRPKIPAIDQSEPHERSAPDPPEVLPPDDDDDDQDD